MGLLKSLVAALLPNAAALFALLSAMPLPVPLLLLNLRASAAENHHSQMKQNKRRLRS